MAMSQRLREKIYHAIEQTSNDLRLQTEATNFDFRKRIYEVKRTKEELEYQMKTVILKVDSQSDKYQFCSSFQTRVS